MNKIQTYYLFRKIREEYCKTCYTSCFLKKYGELWLLKRSSTVARGYYVGQWKDGSCSFWKELQE